MSVGIAASVFTEDVFCLKLHHLLDKAVFIERYGERVEWNCNFVELLEGCIVKEERSGWVV